MTTRRTFLSLAAQGGLGIAAATVLAGAARAAAPACPDPATLSMSQRSRRRAVEYVDASADPARHCGLCAFFTGDASGCGTCQILSGGPVSAGGVCASFAPKTAG